MKAAAFRLARTISFLVLALGLSAARGSADWAPGGNRIDDYPSQYPRIAADPFAGLLVNLRLSSYTRVLPSGEFATGWPVTPWQGLPASDPVPDGIAGMYTAHGNIGYVGVMRLLSDGTPHPDWPSGGIGVCNAPGYKYANAGPDGAGGVYVFWGDGRNPDPSIGGLPSELYGTRVLADGSIASGWNPQGTLLATAPESADVNVGPIRPDGVGGAFEIIEYATHPAQQDEQRTRYLLHVEPDGTIPAGWPSGGLRPPNVSPQQGFGYEPDGTGGAFVTWFQPQNGTFGSRLLRLLASGDVAPGWPAGGVPDLVDSTRLHFITSLAADGAGGVFAGVAIDTSGITQPTVRRILHFGGGGKQAGDWPTQGRRLPAPVDTSPDWMWSSSPLLVSDARGGAFAVWMQRGDGQGDYATIGGIHLDHTGVAAYGWPQGGRAVCDGLGQRRNVTIAGDGIGGTYIAWEDHRISDPQNQFFPYATRLDALDVVAVESGGLVASPLRVTPNPFVRSVDLSLTLAQAGNVRLDVFDVSGRSIRRVADGWLAVGPHALSWDGRTAAGSESPPGLYFVRGSVDGRPVGARIVRIQ